MPAQIRNHHLVALLREVLELGREVGVVAASSVYTKDRQLPFARSLVG